LAANEPQTEPQAAATEAHSPRSVPDENMDPHVASVMRMGAQTLDEALGYASTRDLLHLYGAVSDARNGSSHDPCPGRPPDSA
jgi:hypothetical protein